MALVRPRLRSLKAGEEIKHNCFSCIKTVGRSSCMLFYSKHVIDKHVGLHFYHNDVVVQFAKYLMYSCKLVYIIFYVC